MFQTVLGFVVSLCIFAAAGRFAATFVPEAERESVRYVRIASFSAGFSALDVAVSFATRSLDRYVYPLHPPPSIRIPTLVPAPTSPSSSPPSTPSSN